MIGDKERSDWVLDLTGYAILAVSLFLIIFVAIQYRNRGEPIAEAAPPVSYSAPTM